MAIVLHQWQALRPISFYLLKLTINSKQERKRAGDAEDRVEAVGSAGEGAVEGEGSTGGEEVTEEGGEGTETGEETTTREVEGVTVVTGVSLEI